jgi:hypothetical protein
MFARFVRITLIFLYLISGQDRQISVATSCTNLFANRSRRRRLEVVARQEQQQQQQQLRRQQDQQRHQQQEESGAGSFRWRTNVVVGVVNIVAIASNGRAVVKTVQLQAVRTGQRRKKASGSVTESRIRRQHLSGHFRLTTSPQISGSGRPQTGYN